MTFDGTIAIREVPLPVGVHGMIKESPDGIVNIYINAADTPEEKRKTLRHEMRHYSLGHLRFDRPVAQMEAEADERKECSL